MLYLNWMNYQIRILYYWVGTFLINKNIIHMTIGIMNIIQWLANKRIASAA